MIFRAKGLWMGLATAGTLLVYGSAATASEDPKASVENAYQVGKDIADLQREVADLKALLSRLIELDEQRLALMKTAMAGGGIAPSTSPVQPTAPARSSTPPPARAPGRGAITGRVQLPPGVSSAYVYVENIRGGLVRGRRAEVKQKNKQFLPRSLVVQRGTEVFFPNLDSTYHNVFSRSDNAMFDLGIYRKGDEAKSYVFTKPGLTDIYCNMHSKMTASILVVPNHYYTQVGSDGTFRLDRVPSGRRRVVAWAPGAKMEANWVDVGAGGTANTSFSLGAKSKKAHLNKDGRAYGSYE